MIRFRSTKRRFRPSLLATLSAAVLLGLSAIPATVRADTLAVSFAASGTTAVAGNETFGYAFTLTNAVSVTQLGFYDYQNNGLTNAVPVTIWDNTGTALASATLPAGTNAGESGSTLFVTLGMPVTLTAGTYTIGGYVTSTRDQTQCFVNGVSTADGVSYGGPRSVSGDADPTGNAYNPSIPTGYFGPDFQFTAAPEPSTWAMLGLGGAGLLVVQRQRRAAGLIRRKSRIF